MKKHKYYSFPSTELDDDSDVHFHLNEIMNVAAARSGRQPTWLGIHPSSYPKLKKVIPAAPPGKPEAGLNMLYGMRVVVDETVAPGQIKIVDSAGGIVDVIQLPE